MRFNVSYMGADQDVELRWLSGITNAAELLRIATLEVGESVTLRHGAVGRTAANEPFHVTRVS